MKTECRHCGKSFSVPASWVNTQVRCPQCNGNVFVSDAADPGPAPASEIDDAEDDDADFRLAPAVERPKVELFTDAAPNVPAKPAAAEPAELGATAERLCPNCDAILPPDGMLCVECGYHLVMKRVLQTEFQEVEFDDTIGFPRWLHRQLAEDESLDSIVWAFHAVLIAVGIILAAIFHPGGWGVLVVLGLLYTVWYQWTKSKDGFHAWGEWFWQLLLNLRRRWGWRSGTLKPLRQFTTHSPEFGDEQLLGLADVEMLHVLDLEGTSVSGRGLARLAGCDGLRYIVLRRTRVTREAARRLQVMLPDANLWL